MENMLIQQDLQEAREEFRVDSLEGANWAFRKLRAINEKKNEIEKLVSAEMKRIQDWKEKEVAKLISDEEYFRSVIEAYYVKEREVNPKFRLSTPYGKVSTRKSKAWSYTNEDETINWIKDNRLPYIKTTEAINKVEFKKAFKDGIDIETGEVIPGVVVSELETITIKSE